jgi:hypothetical protein
MRNLAIASGIGVFLGYILFYASNVTAPPRLTLSYPALDVTVYEAVVAVSGATDAEAEIRINGELTLTNGNGTFSAPVNLRPGVNTVTVTAKRRYGRERTEVRRVLLAPAATGTPALPNIEQ